MLGWMALVACNGVNGTVNGESVPRTPTSFFVEHEDWFGNDGLIVVYLTTVDIDCERYEDLQEDLEDEASELDLDGYVDVWEENLPETFWEARIYFRVDDPDDDQSDVDFDGQDYDDGLSEDDEAYVDLLHFTDYPSDNWSDIGDNVDLYRSDRGDVGVRRHKPGDRISGWFDAPFVDPDGDDEGEARINFSASYCRGAEDYLP